MLANGEMMSSEAVRAVVRLRPLQMVTAEEDGCY